MPADRTGDHKSSKACRQLSQRQQVQGTEPVVARELLVAKFLTIRKATKLAPHSVSEKAVSNDAACGGAACEASAFRFAICRVVCLPI